jgi:SNF2 family DNA or RNA helicase
LSNSLYLAIATDSFSSDEQSRVEWSENEADDDAVTRHLKKRELAKEKKAEDLAKIARKASGVRKPRAVKKAANTGVGKIAPKKAKLRKKRTYGDDSDESDTLADALPDYFKNRRRAFDASKDEADNNGLRLPPNYDDIYFSDDERMEDLKEKPNFTDIPTRAPYEDKKLRYSLGVVPAPIAQYLREYQVTGAEFLHEAFVYQKGVILGMLILIGTKDTQLFFEIVKAI